MEHQIFTESVLHCPGCSREYTRQMPEDSCTIVFTCPECALTIKPEPGDCCVFCSYGSRPCPPIQQQNNVLFQQRLRWAFTLSLITIGYNTLEGIVSTFFGATDETLALFGFGIDSFAEVLSGVGIAHMVWRMQHSSISQRDDFEVRALRITGFALYFLAAGLLVGAVLSIMYQLEPRTTFGGVLISILSIGTMYFLYKAKLKVGRRLESDPIISDAHCTKTCFYLSFILLLSSILYEVWKIPYVDALGSLGIAWYAWKEGKEAFGKANTKHLSEVDDCC